MFGFCFLSFCLFAFQEKPHRKDKEREGSNTRLLSEGVDPEITMKVIEVHFSNFQINFKSSQFLLHAHFSYHIGLCTKKIGTY